MLFRALLYVSGSMAKTNPFDFLQQVKSEASKVTWPSQKETGITTVMVFVMVFLASIFFLLADQVMSFGVSFVLGLGG
jgi:preprotein translocase subunit SecE